MYTGFEYSTRSGSSIGVNDFEIPEQKTTIIDQADAEVKEIEDLYINPVCKIPVQKSTAKHVLEHNGEKVYFCCDGCKVSFEKEPDLYMENNS